MTQLDALLGTISKDGVELELGSGLNFIGGGITIAFNPETLKIDITITGGGGSGDVVGPGASVDDRLVGWVGTAGDQLQDLGYTIPTLLAAADSAADAGDAATLAAAASLIPAAGGAPANVTKAAASAGAASSWSRSDHKHDITTAAPGAFSVAGVAAAEGAATSLARSDHAHSITGQLPYANFVDGGACSLAGRSANTSGVQASISLGTNGFVALRRSNALIGGLLLDENVDPAALIALSKLATQAARSVVANGTNASAVPTAISGTADQVFCVNGAGTALTFGTVATAGITNDAVTFAKMQNIATDSLIGRDTAATGDPENILLDSATLQMDGSGNLRVPSQLGARGGENVILDLYPSTQQQGTIATAATVNIDVAIPTGKRYQITADVWVDDGAGGSVIFVRSLFVRAHQTGGVAVLATTPVVIDDNAAANWTFTATANSTNVRFALANTSGTTRSYNVAIGYWSMDKP